jgi:hypothetical protein
MGGFIAEGVCSMTDETKPVAAGSGGSEKAGLTGAGSDYERVHLRLPRSDAEALRKLARGRDQTLSATVRFLLRNHLRGK